MRAILILLLACLYGTVAAAQSDAIIDGKRYRSLTVEPENSGTATITTIELREAGTGLATINTDLRAMLAKSLDRARECSNDSLGGLSKEPGDFHQTLEPTWWTDRLLAVSVMTNSTCGGPHPNIDPDYLLWDVMTGKRIAITRWFTAAALKKSTDRERELSRRLKAIVLKHAERMQDDDCAGVLRDNAYFLIQPSPAGMVFSPSLPHVVQACADDIVVPYAMLDAFLKAEALKRLATAAPATPPAAPAR